MANVTNELNHEIGILKKDIKKLRTDFSELVESGGNYGKSKLDESKKKISESLNNIKEQTRQTATIGRSWLNSPARSASSPSGIRIAPAI